jgi:hypothetical protein
MTARFNAEDTERDRSACDQGATRRIVSVRVHVYRALCSEPTLDHGP